MQSQGVLLPGLALQACPVQGEGLALGVALGHPLQAPFQGIPGWEAPGPTGSL